MPAPPPYSRCKTAADYGSQALFDTQLANADGLTDKRFASLTILADWLADWLTG